MKNRQIPLAFCGRNDIKSTLQCHEFATKILCVYKRYENCSKTKKPANLTICRLYLLVGRAGFEL